MAFRLRDDQGGFAVVTAVILMGFMLTSGLVLARLTDAQTASSGKQRARESALTVGEVALNAQALRVAQSWPGTQARQFGACTQATTGAPGCPTAAQIAGASPTTDAARGLAWRTQVFDNVENPGAPSAVDLGRAYFSDPTHAAAPGFDRNADGAVWVRAEATLNGRARRVVVLLRRRYQEEQVVRAPVLSGSIEFRNNGRNKEFIGTGTTGVVYVRCTVETATTTCLGKPKGNATSPEAVRAEFASHVKAPRYQEGFAQPTAMTADALARARQDAIDAGTFYTSCSQVTTLNGPLIWLEGISCSFTGNVTYNQPPAEPGLLVVNGGTLELGGTLTYHGVIYAPNPANAATNLVTLNGTVTVHGGILVDGPGGVMIGASGGQVKFDESAFRAVRTRAEATSAQGTWRELPPPTAAAG